MELEKSPFWENSFLKFWIFFCKMKQHILRSFCPSPSISRTMGQKYRDREIVSRRSPMFWSHTGQKDRFIIFSRGASKSGKKSRRETFGTIGVTVRSFFRSKFRKFDPWSHLKRTEPSFWLHAGQKHHLVASRSKRPIRNFRPRGAQNG